MLVRLDYGASVIINANHCIVVSGCETFAWSTCVADCIRFAVPQPTEWQSLGYLTMGHRRKDACTRNLSVGGSAMKEKRRILIVDEGVER